MVEVFKFNNKNEVPLDRVLILSKSDHKPVFLSKGDNTIVMTGSNGNQIKKIKVKN